MAKSRCMEEPIGFAVRRAVGGRVVVRGLTWSAIAGVCLLTGCSDHRGSNFAPIARFTIDPTQGLAPLEVTLDGSASVDPLGQIESYGWDFGDGSLVGSGPVTRHTYRRAGTFTVTLTVTDRDGASTEASQVVEVPNQAPVAEFAPYFDSGFAMAVMRFDATASRDPDGQIDSYRWDFGDGGSASGVVVDHLYGKAGEYAVTLTVTDNFSSATTVQSNVTVRPASEYPVYDMLDLGGLGGSNSEGHALNESGQVTGRAEINVNDITFHAFVTDARQRMVSLGTLGGRFSEGAAINNQGLVTGYAEDVNGLARAFVAGIGVPLRDLGTLGGQDSWGADINDAGVVSGTSSVGLPPHHRSHAFVARPGQPLEDLGVLVVGGYSQSAGINGAGQVAGSASTAQGLLYPHAFLATPGAAMLDLGTLGGPFSLGRDINESGQVTGFAYVGGDGPPASHPRAFVFTPGQGMVDLGTLGGPHSEGFAINEAGQVTGWSETALGHGHAFIATPGGGMIDLGTLGGATSYGVAINDLGQVAGGSFTADGFPHAFVTTVDGRMIDLGTLGGAQSYASDINDLGQVTGTAFVSLLQRHAFLATPIALLFSRLQDTTATVTGAAFLLPIVASSRQAYDARDLPRSCRELDRFITEVVSSYPEPISEADAGLILEHSANLGLALRCPIWGLNPD